VKHLNKNLKWIIIALVTLSLGVAVAYAVQEYIISQTVTVSGIGLAFTLDGIPFDPKTEGWDWETITAGETVNSVLTVTNTGSITVTLTFTNDLPEGWLQIWTPDSVTIAPTETATGPLTLTAPADAQGGTVLGWTFTVTATEA